MVNIILAQLAPYLISFGSIFKCGDTDIDCRNTTRLSEYTWQAICKQVLNSINNEVLYKCE